MAGALISPQVAFRIGVLLVTLCCLHTTMADTTVAATTAATTESTTQTSTTTTPASSGSIGLRPWETALICLGAIDFVLVFSCLCYFGMLQITA